MLLLHLQTCSYSSRAAEGDGPRPSTLGPRPSTPRSLRAAGGPEGGLKGGDEGTNPDGPSWRVCLERQPEHIRCWRV